MSVPTPKNMPNHKTPVEKKPETVDEPSWKQVEKDVEKKPFVRKPHLTQRPLRNHEGLQTLKTQLTSDK